MELQVSLAHVTHALSDALDLVGVDYLYHSKRVARIALACAEALGLPAAQQQRIVLASLLHDSGVSSTRVHRSLIDQFEWSDSGSHCDRGHELLSLFAPFRDLVGLVRHHHTRWELAPESDLGGDDALLANLVCLADRVDSLYARRRDRDPLLLRTEIDERIAEAAGTLFAPELVEVFHGVSRVESLWLMLEPRHLDRYIRERTEDAAAVGLGSDQLRELADLFSVVVDSKSHFTAEHSRGVARTAVRLGGLAGLDAEQCRLLEIAALVHDVGKLRVPDEILDKPGPLDRAEMAVMRCHTFETYQIVSRMPELEFLAGWAAYHHECLHGDGYPFHIGEEGLDLQARIMAVADVVQALAQNRPYRKSMPMERILPILGRLAERRQLDGELVALVEENAQACWDAAVGARSGAVAPPAEAPP